MKAKSETEVKRESWRKQFSKYIQEHQTAFDALFGIIVPIVLLMFDPFIFRVRFSNIRVFAYSSISIGIFVLALWMIYGPRLGIFRYLVAGILFYGVLFSSILGLVLMPYVILLPPLAIFFTVAEKFPQALIGILGILGIVPFITASVYLRNANKAFGNVIQTDRLTKSELTMLLGLVLAIAIPFFIQSLPMHSVDRILHGNPQEIQVNVRVLKIEFWCTDTCYDEIVREYVSTDDEDRREFLAKIYKEITGQDIQVHIRASSD